MTRTVGAALFGVVLTAGWAVLGEAPVAAAASGPCPDSGGVTVVVDYGPLPGGVQVSCAAGDPSTGADALRRAGFEIEGTVRMPGFLCRIDGQPTPEDDPCVLPSPGNAYWSYWTADRGGAWHYSASGMMGRDPEPGTVEGWVFTTGGPNAPRSSTFPTTTVPPPTARTTTAPGPRLAPPRDGGGDAPPATSRAPGPRSPGGRPPPDVAGATAGPRGGRDTGSVTATDGSDTTTTSTTTTAETATTGPSGEAESDDEGSDAPPAEASKDRDSDGEQASSTVEAADSATGSGSMLGTGLAVGGIAAVGAAAVVTNRRRFRVHSTDGGDPPGPTGSA